jgi:hypothetical protein
MISQTIYGWLPAKNNVVQPFLQVYFPQVCKHAHWWFEATEVMHSGCFIYTTGYLSVQSMNVYVGDPKNEYNILGNVYHYDKK